MPSGAVEWRVRFYVSEPIKVWRFNEAPAEYRELSCNGGDEDWVALVPAGFTYPEHVIWLEPGSAFGCCDVERHAMPDGSFVYIGCHA
jgi:hypothetical protein